MSYINISRRPLWVALFAAGIAAGIATLPACSSLPTSSAFGYAQGNTQQVQQVQLGTVLAVIPVSIQPQTSGLGPLAGLAAGGALGNQIGNGNGRTAATLIGAVAGAIAGGRAEASATQTAGEQVTVRLQNGGVIAVTQAADAPLRVGESVQVIGGGWGGQPARVLPLAGGPK